MNDRQLAELLRAQPEAGLRQLLEQYGARVKGALLIQFLPSVRELVEEAISEASLTVFRKIESFDEDRGSIFAWFYTIARNATVSALRREALWLVRAQLHERIPAPLESEPALVAERPLIRDLWRCIAALPPMQRKVLTADLRAGGVACAAHVAAQLHTTTNAVHVARCKGRAALRRCLYQRGYLL